MIRTPLRPLAKIIRARAIGKNPDLIEAAERRKRNTDIQSKLRRRAEMRLVLLGVGFFVAFGAIGTRMAMLAATEPVEKRTAILETITNKRADIVDRNGAVLATNLATTSLYAQPPMMVEPLMAAEKLAEIFPDLDKERLVKDFTGKRKFLWIKKTLSPTERQLVHDIGEPGLQFGPREMRLYPNGRLAAHILGGASFGKEGVRAAEVVGVAGVENRFDDALRDPKTADQPLQLSIDLSVQAATRQVLGGGMRIMQAAGASAILMDVHSGEILSMVSLPDFDPNDRPRPLTEGDASLSPLFNRAAQGRYELGSTFKLFAAAVSLEQGLANPSTKINTRGPLKWGKFKIKDFHDYGHTLSLKDVIVKSSNIGTARIALEAGTPAQQAMLHALGLLDPLDIEIPEAGRTTPLIPDPWSELSTMTISYGHGIATTPLHLAGAYATLVNGGYQVKPTLLKHASPTKGAQILSAKTSRQLTDMLRSVVTEGTASFGDVEGYEVGGKTGSADKPKPSGGYYEDKVIATFAATFPTSNPQYVLVLSLDEPKIQAAGEERRTAGWTAVPVAAELIGRVAPLLGLRPIVNPVQATYTSANN